MNGNIFMSAGVAVGIFMGLIVALFLIKLANSNRKVRSEYDERQLRVRGDAYRYAFYTVVVWEAVLIVLAYGDFHLPVPDLALHFAGIVAGGLVLSTVCIWKDAYWGLNNNRRSYGIILVVAGLFNAIPVIGSLSDTGGSDFPYVNLLCCVMLVVVGAELLLKQMADKQAESAEDDA